MSNDIDLAAEFADDAAPQDAPVLPPLEQLYGDDALPSDIDLEAMISVATDPETPAPEGDLIPDMDSGFEDTDFAAEPELDDLNTDFGGDQGFHEDTAEDHFTVDATDPTLDSGDDLGEMDPGV